MIAIDQRRHLAAGVDPLEPVLVMLELGRVELLDLEFDALSKSVSIGFSEFAPGSLASPAAGLQVRDDIFR